MHREPCYHMVVRAATLLALMVCGPGAAQVIVNPARLSRMIGMLEAKPGETVLRCEVAPTRPALNYGFRFQAGYRVTIPAKQFFGPGHRWTTLERITPLEAGHEPVYLANFQRLPDVPKTSAQLQFGGGYLLGEGVYHVDWALRDEQGRVCRKSWKVDVHRGRQERDVKVAMPGDTVWDFSLRGARLAARDPDDAAGLRLTILLNLAPMTSRRTHLRVGDIASLISAASSLLERVPAREVRMVVFNLEQQKEIYRKENFQLENMPEVARAMNTIDLNTVDYQVLQKRQGHVELLAGLMNRELKAERPSDVVLFIGPVSRYEDRVPAELLEKPAGPAPQFMDIQMMPVYGPPSEAFLPDVIRNAISRLGGKNLLVRTPGEFAKAITKLENLPR